MREYVLVVNGMDDKATVDGLDRVDLQGASFNYDLRSNNTVVRVYTSFDITTQLNEWFLGDDAFGTQDGSLLLWREEDHDYEPALD